MYTKLLLSLIASATITFLFSTCTSNSPVRTRREVNSPTFDYNYALASLPHGLLSITEAAMKELDAPDVATARQQLETPSEALVAQGRRFMRAISRHFKPAVDHFELKTGHRIDEQLQGRLPNVGRKDLRIALGMHTHSLRYLKVMAQATVRVDLDGQPAGEILATHRSHASDLIKERTRKQAEQRKAQREAEALARQRTEKLDQLVEKFGRSR